jgi:hypothetical protein
LKAEDQVFGSMVLTEESRLAGFNYAHFPHNWIIKTGFMKTLRRRYSKDGDTKNRKSLLRLKLELGYFYYKPFLVIVF